MLGSSRTEFVYERPMGVGQALEMLAEEQVVSRPIAGGTDLLPAIRGRPLSFDRVIDISAISELKGVEEAAEDDRVRIGACVTFSEAKEDPILIETAPLLTQACRFVGSEQIRNLGTLGGNIMNASPCADSLPVWVCLGAVGHLRSMRGERTVPIEDLVIGPGRTSAEEDELLVAISFSKPSPKLRSAFVKVGRRNPQDIARVSVAAMGSCDAEGKVSDLRFAAGAVFPRPVRVAEVEDLLLGQPPDSRLLVEAGERAAGRIGAREQARWSRPYKVSALGALTERALRRVLDGNLIGDEA